MYAIKVRPVSGREIRAREAVLNESGWKQAQDLSNTHQEPRRFSGRRIRILQTILACGISLALSGCGGIVQNKAALGSLTTSPSSVDFGTVNVGNTANSQVTVSNQGPGPAEISQLSVSDPSFSVDGQGNLPITLPVGGTLNIKVLFTPQAAADATGQLSVMTGTSSPAAASVKLHGKGFASVSTAPALSALSCSSASMTGSGADACTVTLSGSAPSGGVSVSLSSSNVAVSVPASVTVPANSTSASFSATVSAVSTAQSVTLTASANGVSKNVALQLNSAVPTLSFSASSLSFGSVALNTSVTESVTLTSTGTAPVTISIATAKGAGFSVSGGALPATLNPGQSLNLGVQFDPTVTGAATGQLTVTSNSSTNPTALIALGGTGVSTSSVLSALSCSNASMTGSGTDACSVTLSGSAPSGGLSVSLSSSNAAVKVPAFVTVPANSTSASFSATVSSVSAAQSVTLTASANGVSKSVALQLNAAISTLSISASSESFGTVNLNTAATKSLTLTSTGTAAVNITAVMVTGTGFSVSGTTFPSTLNPGQAVTLSVQFNPTVTGSVTGQLTITSDSSTNPTARVSLSGTGTSTSSVLSALSCSNASMTGSGTDACSVTLSSLAPSGGLSVSLSSSSAAVTVPASVAVPANAASVGFTATVSSVRSAQSVTLTATTGTASQIFALQLNAAAPTLSINATSIGFGNVVVNTPATQSLTLSSTGGAPVTISAAAITGTGFTMSGSTFPVTLNPSQRVTLSVQFDPATAGAATGQITITSNSSTSPKAVISLSGTGEASSHQVVLSWQAPTNSAVPVSAYNVYRAPGGSSSYQLIDQSDTQTTYTDTAVQSGQSYDYVVKSVDSAGVESAPSNMTSVTIP